MSTSTRTREYTRRSRPSTTSRDARTERQMEGDPSKLMHLLQTESAGYLEAEGMERTYEIRQEELLSKVPLQAAAKRFDLKLPEGGGYRVDYTRDGRFLLLSGRNGHVAAMEWARGKLRCELQLEETVYGAKWLQNEMLFAVAQSNYVYIYDHTGAEAHRLNKHQRIKHMDYLSYHYLLVTCGEEGILRYQDISTGQLASELFINNSGNCRAMCHNSTNGIIHMGHARGTVTLWSPTQKSGPLVTMQCHKGPIQAVAIDPEGTHMVTAGLDGLVKIWDLRTYTLVHPPYPHARPATSLDISQRGLLAIGHGPHVRVWKEAIKEHASEPYMHHLQSGEIVHSVRFVPFDDILGVGHSAGMSSLLIPGAGEPNYDSFEVNPFATSTQRREAEVKHLLDKLPAETIMLDTSFIGSVLPTDQDPSLESSFNGISDATEDQASAPSLKKKKKLSSKTGRIRRSAKEEEKIRAKRTVEQEKVRERVVIASKSDRQEAPRTALDRFKTKSL